MTTAETGFLTLDPPQVFVTERDPTLFGPDAARHQAEKAKYEKAWQLQQYRAVAPGESIAAHFLDIARPEADATVIDFGAGTGRGALMMALLGGVKVHMLDFVSGCLDEEIREALATQNGRLKFTEHNLVKKAPVAAPYGFCTDVMEHIPPQDVDTVLDNILLAAQHVFFQIACEDDVMGALVGEPLHLSVHNYDWWHKKFRDRDCVVHFSKDFGSHCLFYVTAWQTGDAIVEHGRLNVTEEQVEANVRANIAAGFEQVQPYPTNNVEVVILGGGPSLALFWDDIKRHKARGCKIVTLNNVYTEAQAQGLGPNLTQIMVDAREFNARFVDPVREESLYLIASQCHPAVLAKLPRERTLLWHTTAETIKDVLDDAYAGKPWWGIPGGSTVLLRAIPLLRMLGFRKFHLYGCDSCLMGEAHHAYSQPENDGAPVIPVNVGGRTFMCHPWMIAQAQELIDLIKVMGKVFALAIYGDGLLHHILQTGAALSDATLSAAKAAQLTPET